ncbi:hypothetical protein vseg_016710 [Gypsophila vaccaria]
MEAQLNVQVISNDTVKPSRPTPIDRNIITLSFLDEILPTFHVPTLFIYNGNEFTKTSSNITISDLKSSLSETLTQFYPLAGRLENEYTVSCNDQGIPFLTARVDCQLIDFLNSPHKLDALSKFHPPKDLTSFEQRPISEIIPLAFQVNFFTCGGVAIGCYFTHKLLDATSLSIFLNYWAAHASGQHQTLVKPDFDTIIGVFPPLSKNKRVKITTIFPGDSDKCESNNATTAPTPAAGLLCPHLKIPIKIVKTSFKFTNTAIKKLKIDGASETVPNPSSFEAVVGFIWMHVMDAIQTTNNNNIELGQPIPNVLSFSASLRSRANPQLPKQSMGNIITPLRASVAFGDGFSGDKKYKETIREIHGAIKTLNQTIQTLKDDNEDGDVAYVAKKLSKDKDFLKNRSSIFAVVSWVKLGFNDVDFGFGPPIGIFPLAIGDHFGKNSMRMIDYSDGIEVFVCLEDKCMSSLQTNAQFLAFATKG